jgi:hypothetical protein
MLASQEMSQSRNQLAPEYSAVEHGPIEYLTENGFSLIRLSDPNSIPAIPGEFGFLVRDPHGYELDITVSIDQSIYGEVTRRSRGRISSKSSYWICCAERHLAAYLWENDDYPPDAKLDVDDLTLDDINLAGRWDCDT